MKTVAVIGIILAAVFLSSAQTNGPATSGQTTQPQAEQTLQNLEREWGNAVAHHDVETINRIQAEEFEFTDPAGQIWTKARALESIRNGQLQVDSFEMSEFKIRIYGDTAVVNFRVVWNGTFGEADISGPQRMTDIFVRRDGNWQCVASQATRIPAPRKIPASIEQTNSPGK